MQQNYSLFDDYCKSSRELRKPFTKCIFLSTSSFNSSVILLLIPIEAKLIVHSLLNFPCAFHHFPKFSSWRVFAFWPLFQYFSLYRGSFMSLEKPLNPQYDEGMVLNQKKFSPATTNIAICHHHHFLSILYLTSSLRRANTSPIPNTENSYFRMLRKHDKSNFEVTFWYFSFLDSEGLMQF